jgi:hypothetical protein
MNPISTFVPTVGAHVHDTLNNMWITLTAEDVEDMESELREHGRRERAFENWDGFILDGWLPPEVTPPPTVRTPGPGDSQLQTVRIALNSNAIEHFSLHREQVEAMISEARAEGISEAVRLVEQAEALPESARDWLLVRLRQL